VSAVVLDASVVLKWFVRAGEPGLAEARGLREEYRAGRLFVTVPTLLFIELMNVAGRRWGWDEDALHALGAGLHDLLFDVADPDLVSLSPWVAGGLTAYDAVYIALAEERGIPLITADRAILDAAGDIARALVPE
jgi:predicted nucleic acid-binding protein